MVKLNDLLETFDEIAFEKHPVLPKLISEQAVDYTKFFFFI